jgi:hypothetical protein
MNDGRTELGVLRGRAPVVWVDHTPGIGVIGKDHGMHASDPISFLYGGIVAP